ncbi:MAG: cysteine desulfurase [Deltaproteobacteria bacterium]|nr:cysteine desulfurase [Deltaproteobacteria bacterium]
MKTPSFDIEKIREEFPTLHQEVHGKPLVYLDNAATTQKPRAVIEKLHHYYTWDNANIHRGVHTLSERSTQEYEAAREKIRQFIHAKKTSEIIFTRGTTESINLVAQTYGREHLQAGDEIIISHMEHHSNIVPWQILAEQSGAQLKVVPITDQGELDLEAYQKLFSKRTKLVSMVYVSNSLGTVNPIKQVIEFAHQAGVPVLVDGAQAVNHLSIDVQDLDADFFAFSGHKLFGPTGIGVLYGKEQLLEKMPPYQGGGDMIRQVSFEKTTYNDLPYKFEAGTPHIAGAIGLGAAIDYLQEIGMSHLATYERDLLDYASKAFEQLPDLKIIGQAKDKTSVISFVLKDIHPHDIGTILDREGVAVRAGHHCTMPLMQRFQVPATVRASFAFYNTFEEIDKLVEAVKKVQEVFTS